MVKERLPYVVLMGTCLVLVLVAWTVVRTYSMPAALIMTVIAMVIPPIAAIVANAGREGRAFPPR